MLEYGQIERRKKKSHSKPGMCRIFRFPWFSTHSLTRTFSSVDPIMMIYYEREPIFRSLSCSVCLLVRSFVRLLHGQNNALVWKSNCNCYHISFVCKRQRKMQKEPENRLEYLGHIVEYSNYGTPYEWLVLSSFFKH